MDKKDREESLQEAGSRKQNRRKWRGGENKSIMQGNRWAPRKTEPQHCKGLPQHQAGWIKKRSTVRQVTINLHNTVNRKIPSFFREGNTSSAKKWNDLSVLWSATAFRNIAKPLGFWWRASHSQTSGHVGRVIFIHANKLSYKLSFDSSREVTWGYTPGKWESKVQKRKKKWISGIYHRRKRAKAKGQRPKAKNLRMAIWKDKSWVLAHMFELQSELWTALSVNQWGETLMFQPLWEASSVPVTNILTPEPFFFFL